MKMKRIFIVGCPRSGTTLVQSIVASHSAVHSFTESHFFFFMPRRMFPRRTYARWEMTIKKFIEENITKDDAVIEILMKQFASLQTTNEKVGWFISLLDNAAIKQEKHCWVEKTPDHLFSIPVIQRFCPGAQFVHVIRKPETNIPALQNTVSFWKGRWNKFWLKNYLHWILSARKSKKYIWSSNHTFVFYEDLLENSSEQAILLQQCLGIPVELDILQKRKDSAKAIISSNEHWKSDVYQDIGVVTETLPTIPQYLLPLLHLAKKYYSGIHTSWHKRVATLHNPKD